ncbi:SIN3-HDAC complex-associated factor-like [Hydractinia symbiolongicarpus]|uniref:SIN3-HDAC complex-associated factor-like n=1 Tax=Hydractinia symbiolongicarpus TaxID=13093 RepID=UPI00254CD035|nr:SIN3-HDAC complex-associated factor-like [Hydractinia symbiolongicarpus]XP_057309956.1 SIN3-HDAC complex-associated factor-like [Hydractinia symbiolongicarpus]XP_057309957.1 SIN3-HDAC complex-associated factor-like [Hydractinia symbiolongicarpus]
MRSERRTLFRSIAGCTICGVKSARHPFQDSAKWSKYYEDCFKLSENRTNEICYLCLKSVKKWRRTPKYAKPDFSSAVDSKCAGLQHRRSSIKKRRSSSLVEMEIGTKEENKVALMEEDDLLSENDSSEDDVDSTGVPSTYFDTPSPDSLTNGNGEEFNCKQTKDVSCQTSFLFPSLTSPQANEFKLPYIDLSKWRQEQICCGVIFRGPAGEVLVDPKWLNPSCGFCNRSCSTPSATETSKEISIFDHKLIGLVESSS